MGAVFAPISFDITDSSEHSTTDGAYVKVNCDVTRFISDVGWIT